MTHDGRPPVEDPQEDPPRLALWLLERRIPEHEREFLIGDLVEEFHAAIGAGTPVRTARRHFWREALSAAARRERDTESIPFTRGLMSDLSLDVTLALRRVRNTPGFSLATSLTLALGVGAACAIVAVARPALWGALPFREADRIVTLRETGSDGTPGRMGFITIHDLAGRVGALESVAAGRDVFLTLQTPDGTVRLTGMAVNASWFDVMGVRLAVGRGFFPEEDRPNSAPSVVLTDQLWRARFSGDSTVVGRSIVLNELSHQVVGVLPPSHESVLLPGAEFLVALRYADSLSWACRNCRHLQGVARVKAGVPIDEAARQTRTVFDQLRSEHPSIYGQNGVLVTPLRTQLVEPVRAPLLALLGAAALLLAIALANATNLLVARGAQREGEVTVRMALGATRWRVTRGLLIEALLLSALGALFGLALAHATVGALVALAPPSLPRLDQIRIDAQTIGLAAVLAVILGVVSGVAPAVLVRRSGLRERLTGTSRAVARGGHDVLRRGLVVTEIALALLLLGGAGILVRSVERLLAVDVGFAAENRLVMALGVGGPRYRNDSTVYQVWRGVHSAVGAIPGVTGVTLTSQLPLSPDFDSFGVAWEHRPDVNPAEYGDAFRLSVTPDYAAVMGLELRQGRFLEAADDGRAAPVAVINEFLARREFGTRNPIGGRLRMGGEDVPWRTVVGVVNDVQHPTLDAPPSGQVYLPLEQHLFAADRHLRVVARSNLAPAVLARQMRDAMTGVDPSMSVAEIAPLTEVVEVSAQQRRFARRLFQVFSTAALALAAVGIFGVMSGMVGERTREIGVRSALGATQRQIVGHFVRAGGVMIGTGVVIGVLGSLALAGALRSLVFGVSARDPVILTVVSVGLALVALLATLWPAWRASRVDAVVALRAE